MSNSFKANENQIQKIINFYKENEIEVNPSLYLFNAKNEDTTISIFHNGTIMFQGKNATNEYDMWANILQLKQIENNNEAVIVTHMGSDEVGCGDYFGPMVVCATLVKDSDYAYLKEIGVKDSKQLSKIQIKTLAAKIKEKVTSTCVCLSNSKYNELHNKGYNLNKIKAYLHNFVLLSLKEKINFDGMVVVDQFCSEQLYYKYLSDYSNNKVLKNIYFTPKAENKYLAVACASIIARDAFLDKMDELYNETGYHLLLGSGSDVDNQAKQILNEKGIEFFKKYAKFHFNNTLKITQN